MSYRAALVTLAAVMGALIAAAGLTTYAARADTPRLEWRVEDDHAADGTVDLTLSYRREMGVNSYGRNVPLADLKGLTREQLAVGASQVVSFRLVRDAGTFVCEGSAARQLGSGVCDFQPGAAFAQRLRAMGAGEADENQLLQLAMADIGGTYLDELKRQKYAMASVPEIVRAGQHGVGLRYLQEMGAAGYSLPNLGALSDLRDHGVNPRFITALKEVGYTGLPVETITRLRDHGVTPDYIKGMAALGYRNISPDDLTRLRDHGVTVSFAASIKDLGYGDISAEELTRLRDHGVSATFIRRVNGDGPRVAIDDVIRMRDRGEFPRERAER